MLFNPSVHPRISLLWLPVLFLGSWISAGMALSADAPRKLLFIGIDGCRPDALLAADTPNIDSVTAVGAVNYEAQIRDGQITVSGPGWSSMLTGVWADKHQVFDNDFAGPNLDQYPVFFQRLREIWPEVYIVSVVHWKPINASIIEGADEELYGTDEEVGQLGAKALSNPGLDALFVAFDDVDGAGHGCCYDPANQNYLSVIEKTDGYVGKVLDALRARPTYSQENWLIVITADHGGINKGHGGDTPEEKTIFLIVSGPDSLKGIITPAPMLVDAAVTALTFLGGKVRCDWDLDGKAFGLDPKVFPEPSICPRCPRNFNGEVNEEKGEVTLKWIPGQAINLTGYEILRDGKPVGSVGLSEDHYTDRLNPDSITGSQVFTYTLRMKGVSPALVCQDLACTVEYLAGTPFFTENFDALESQLGKAVGETKCVAVSGWTQKPPAGWSIDNSGMGASPGIPEWRGWTFATPAFWTCVEDQRRGGFTRGTGVIAIADPDEWADTEPPPAKGETFNSVLVSPPIDLPEEGETLIAFDSHYRQEGTQRTEFRVSIDGGADQVLLRYSRLPKDNNGGKDVIDKRVRVRLPAQSPQSKVVLKWALLDGDNNWFWAIDNVELYNSK
jgi:hypothetical protein